MDLNDTFPASSRGEHKNYKGLAVFTFHFLDVFKTRHVKVFSYGKETGSISGGQIYFPLCTRKQKILKWFDYLAFVRNINEARESTVHLTMLHHYLMKLDNFPSRPLNMVSMRKSFFVVSLVFSWRFLILPNRSSFRQGHIPFHSLFPLFPDYRRFIFQLW